jgi:hypothetical protein
MIGASVVFTNVNGLQRRGRVITQDEATGLIQVEWQPWPAYLATLPHPTDDDRAHCAAHRSWTYPPDDSRHPTSISLKVVE